jgi:hypothetical protein
MTLPEVLAELREQAAYEALAPHWEESMSLLGKEPPAFLSPEDFLTSREWSDLPAEADSLLRETAQRIREHPALLRLAWHCYRLLYYHLDYNEMGRWPTLAASLGEASGAYYMLIALGMIPLAREKHRQMGLPEEVSRATMTQLQAINEQWRSVTGQPLGYWRHTIYWLRNYVAGILFRVGRLEYMIKPLHDQIVVYRHKGSGAVIALAADGQQFDAEGYQPHPLPSEGIWSAILQETERDIIGFPISPLGMAVQKQVRLPKPDWELALKPGDLTLDMHIPGGGGMSLEKCRDSLQRAVPFFRRVFPDQPFQAIHCGSWIFNNQLEQIPLSSDNLVRFQRELYLYPIPSGNRDGLWFVFLQHEDQLDLAKLPRDTSLRRAVADFLAAGNRWRVGGMFFLTDDLARFDTQYYRSHWPPPDLGLE